MSGTLYGLGIGPGDPDLVTVKARNILQAVPVIAYPAPEGGESLVRAIAAPHIPEGRTEIVIRTPMAIERFPARDVYDRCAEAISAHLTAGRDVAVLCEGDPFLYGSFMYIHERIAGRHRALVVPGVSSLAAVAAVAGVPLVSRDEILTVLPATLAEPELEARLAATDAAAVLKVGRHLAKARRALGRLGLEKNAWYIERATMKNQKVLPLVEVGEDPAPYFSTILVRRRQARIHQSASAGPDVPAGVALVALGSGGLALAQRLKPSLPQSRVHGLVGSLRGAEVTFVEAATHLRALFVEGVPIVGVCAAGILIRALAPLLADKHREPPVVALAEDGSVAVPLLGGHRGANRLARRLASITGGVAAITTAGDVRYGFGLDDPPAGWRVANPAAAKSVTGALLAGEPVRLRVEAGDAAWLKAAGAPFADDGRLGVRVTDRVVDGPNGDLVLHPPVLVVGVGCERGVAAEELTDVVRGTLSAHDLATGAVACVASIDLKADEAAVHAVATTLGVPARFFSAVELEKEAPRLVHPSAAVCREVGCHGVAEGAALAAAGPDSVLVVEKTRSRRATCAVARSPVGIDPLAVGRARGRLVVVGVGPGDPAWRTPEANRALAEASDVVGLPLYLDLIADAIGGKKLHASNLSEEEARVRKALDLAAEGRTVALISSGDAGIYGMAALVFELLDRENHPDWNRIEVDVVPGVSALQAAAARAGTPLGHDFCAISLSDLLTPWPEIERRLEAAADADFVVALYNPVSKRRRTQLVAARDILLAKRPAATPVVLARNLGRDGENVRFLCLNQLEPEAADMRTVILVGNSRTRTIERGGRRWIYTPRGYEPKLAARENAPAAQRADG